jgi:hypothetical protein
MRTKIMTTPIKALFATLATGAMAVCAAVPASAQASYGYDQSYGHENRWNGGGWNRGNSRNAIQLCSRVAERQASRNSYGNARVTDIHDVRDLRVGYVVRGRIAVSTRDRGWNDREYGHGWRDNDRRHDVGSFTCRVERGRIAYLDFDGIRGL